MNLSDFEKQVSPVVVDRGNHYFKNGYVSDLQQLSSGEWLAEIEGNYGNYIIEINLDKKGEINDYSCNCPFDGPVCKHMVAVLLAIREEQKLAKPGLNGKKNPPEWESIIANTPEKELRAFLFGFAKNHRDFQNELVVNLSVSPKKIDIPKYQKIIDQALNAAAGRHGFIEYRDTYAALRPVYALLQKADEHLDKGNLHEAFSIAAAVAPLCLETLECIDDSDGQCGGAINYAFDLVDKILDKCSDTHLAETIYDWLLEQIQNPNYDNYGCSDELEPTFFKWATNQERLNKAYWFIESQLKKHEGSDEWSARYRTTKYLKYKTELLVQEGKPDEAYKIIEENLHLSDFRKVKIEQMLAEKNYPEAIRHINEGIEQAEKDKLPGIVHQFKDQLLDIFKQQNNKVNVSKLSKELFLDNRNSFNYYLDYKATFNADEWSGKCEEIIALLQKDKKKSYWGYNFPSELATVYIEEKMWDRLFNEVKQNGTITIVDGYSKHLATHYPNELVQLYRDAIQKQAENTGRDIYTGIVNYLKNMATLNGGKEQAQKLAQQLLETYKNRPAMKDEFKKLNW